MKTHCLSQKKILVIFKNSFSNGKIKTLLWGRAIIVIISRGRNEYKFYMTGPMLYFIGLSHCIMPQNQNNNSQKSFVRPAPMWPWIPGTQRGAVFDLILSLQRRGTAGLLIPCPNRPVYLPSFQHGFWQWFRPYAEGVRRCELNPLAGQIISKSCSFSPDTEFTPLILVQTSGISYDSHLPM